MAGLTVAEKQHWKDRIGRRIDKKIDAIWAEEPNLKDRVGREAKRRAEESLGLAEIQAELDQIEKRQEELESREKQLLAQALAKVRGSSVEDLDDARFWNGHDSEVTQAIDRRAGVFEEQLLADNQRGCRILELRREKENLLDTVWLATSPAQIKELWSKVAALLGDEQTPLQRDALAIAAVEPA
jgi:hypothetical protein